MSSDKDWPELREQLARNLERDKQTKRLLIAIGIVVVSILIMVGGIKVIGMSQTWTSWPTTTTYSWKTFELEVGIFLTLLGTILASSSLNHLMSVWKQRKSV
ncbi:MAG: hypothetical protein MUC90_06510 [Thermoplasmata archaeon]|nr:hypothetical protein [Thermoplasmata archaeon]